MKVIKADQDRRLVIPGVPGVARRPVDIDSSETGFTALRTLRIYRFEADSVVNGHAEEDEVYVVVLSGSIELKIGVDGSDEALHSYTLAAEADSGSDGFVAYLPPHCSYQLTPRTETDIAYARATPLDNRQPAVFRANGSLTGADVDLLLDERTHASRLRLRIVHVLAKDCALTVSLRQETDAMAEGLAHLRSVPAEGAVSLAAADGEAALLESWDTIAIAPGECPAVDVAKGAFLSIMTVLAV